MQKKSISLGYWKYDFPFLLFSLFCGISSVNILFM